MSRTAKAALAIFVALLLLPVAAVAGLALLYQSDGGRHWLAARLETALSEPGKSAVALEGLGGDLFGEITLDRLAVGDASGPWLEGETLALDWSPWALLAGRLEIGRATGERIAVLRRPLASEDERAASGPLLPHLPLPIAIGALEIERIELDEALLGAAAVLTAEGAATASRDGAASLVLSLRRLDGSEGSAALTAALSPQDDRIELSLAVAEPRGGLIARALALPGLPAVAATLDGEGPLSAWQGKLTASLDGAEKLAAALTLDARGPYRFASEGWLDGAALLPGELAPLAEPRLDFAVVATLDRAGETLTVERAELSGPAARASVTGRLDLAAEQAALTWSAAAEGAAIAALIEPLTVERLDMQGELSGALAAPALRIDATLDALRHPELALETARLRASARPQGDGWLLQASLDDAGARYRRPILAALLGPSPTATLAGLYRRRDATLALDSLELAGAAATLRGEGEIARSGAARLALVAEIADLSALAQASGLSLTGAGRIEAALESADLAAGATLAVTAKPRNFSPGIAELDPLIGATPTLSARLIFEDWQSLAVEDAVLDGAALRASGKARLADNFERLDADYTMTLPRLAALESLLGLPIAGSASVEGRASGPLAAPTLRGTLAAQDLVLDERPLGKLSGRYGVTELAAARGEIALALDSPEGPLAAESRFAFDRDFTTLSLDGVTLSSGGNTLAGSLALPLDGAPVSGKLSGKLGELAPLGALAGLELGGGGALELALSAREGRQAAEIAFEGARIALTREGETIRAATLKAKATLDDLLGAPRGEATLAATALQGGGFTLASVTAQGRGDLAALDFRATAQGEAGLPFDLATQGTLTRSGAQTAVALAKLEGTLAEQPLALTRPVALTYGAERLAVDDLALAWAGGRLDGRLSLDPRALDLALSAERLPLALAALLDPSLKLDGTLKLAVALEGPPAAPRGSARAEIAGLAMPDLPAELPKLDGSAEALFRDGRFEAKGALTGFQDSDISFALALPVAVSAAPVSLAVAADAPLEGSAKLRGPLAPLWQMTGIDLHRLEGSVAADLTLAGTVAAPRVSGRAQLSDGLYESFEGGTLLKGMELAAVAEGGRLTIESFSAGDGGAGRITGSGSIELSAEKNFPLDLAFALHQATLIRRDEVTATMSGEVMLAGDANDLTLTGTLVSDLIEARLVDRLPPEVVTLPVEEVGGGAEAQDAEARGTVIALDMTLDLPRRVFLRGRGLDSEWGGRLAVTGTTAAPQVKGELKPIRGQFDFAGRVFKLGEGSVAFDGGAPNPRLDLTAEHQAQELLALVRITGQASAPEIAFDSRPPLPRDEILSRVLFGKARGKLTSGEAVQLASTARALTGGGEAGILDKARQTLGVDVLRLTGGDGAPAGVAVGKYLSEEVYIGVEQGAGKDQTSATVEVEITPNITVEGDVGPSSGGRVGAKWHWDY